jgi:predicted phosphodiesterase
MRLAVFSDIHGNLIAFEAMLADLASVGEVDLIWCLGDLAMAGARAAECVQRVQALAEQYGKEKFHVIGGNTDRYLVTGERFPLPPVDKEENLAARAGAMAVRDRVVNWNLATLTFADYEFLAKILGCEVSHRVDGFGRVIGFHAVPGSDEPTSLLPDSPDEEARDSLLDRAGRLALAGHTHHKMDRDLGRWRVINPGSVGMSFTQHGFAEWALLTIDQDGAQVDFRAVPYDIAAVIADARAAGRPEPEWLEKRLRSATG